MSIWDFNNPGTEWEMTCSHCNKITKYDKDNLATECWECRAVICPNCSICACHTS